MAEHAAHYMERHESSWAWHHVRSQHRGEQNLFGQDFEVVRCQKEIGAFRRSLREEVTITKIKREHVGALLNDHTDFNSARDLLE